MKKQYVTPALKEHGMVRTLTQASSAGRSHGKGQGKGLGQSNNKGKGKG